MDSLLSKRISKLKASGISSATLEEFLKDGELNKIEGQIDVCWNMINYKDDENEGLTPTRGMGKFNMCKWE